MIILIAYLLETDILEPKHSSYRTNGLEENTILRKSVRGHICRASFELSIEMCIHIPRAILERMAGNFAKDHFSDNKTARAISVRNRLRLTLACNKVGGP